MKHNPQFCTIAPTAYLSKYARHNKSDFHLLLAHLIDPQSVYYDPEYVEFYKNSKLPNETYIADNGAFELGIPYNPDRLIQIGRDVRADILVLPDYPGQSANITIDAAKKYIPVFRAAGFKTFYVPQSAPGDWDGWLRSFEWALFNTDIDVIGMSILAHPIAIPNIPKSYVRVVAADRISNWLRQDAKRTAAFYHKHIHWLGLLNPGLELPALLGMGLVDTLDSSNPVWLGHCGLPYNQFTESWAPVEKKYVPEVNFQTHTNKDTSIIDHNLSIISNTFNHYQK
jgi:hypothetical protein